MQWEDDDVQRIAKYANEEDDHGERIASVVCIAKELRDNLVPVFCGRTVFSGICLHWPSFTPYLDGQQCCRIMSARFNEGHISRHLTSKKED
jgi:hypothetical protein